MPPPGQDRLDVLSEAIASVLIHQREIDARLARIETALGLSALKTPGAAVSSRPPEVPESPHAPPEPLSRSVIERERTPEPGPVANDAAGTVPPNAPDRGGFETRMGLTLLNRAGVVTLVLGVLFFFKYAVDNKWIGETGRVMLGILAGFAALAVADFFWRKGQRTFAQGISGCGIAILYVSFYASFSFYGIVPQPLAFLLMGLNTAAAGVLATRYGAQAIAALGLAGGYLTPVLLSTGENRPWALFGYVLLLDLGAVWLSRSRSWRPVQVLAAVSTYILYFSWLATALTPDDKLVATLFAFVFYSLFAISNLRPVVAGVQVAAAISLAIIHGPGPVPLLPLLLLMLAAGLAVADRRGWTESAGVAVAAFWLAFAIRHSGFHAAGPETAFAFLTLGFLMVLLWIPWRARRSEPIRALDLAVLASSAAAFFSASYSLLEKPHHAWMGLFAAVVGAVHFGVARRLWTDSRPDNRTVLFYSAIALAFLTLAIPIQFAGYRITIAWALEGAALAWIGGRVANARLTTASVAVLALALLRLLALDAHTYPDPHAYTAILNARFLTFSTTAVALWLGARANLPGPTALATYVAGHFALLFGLILEITGWASRTAAPADEASVASTSVSILLAAYAVLLVGLGVRTRTVLNRILGLGLIALVVLKLYFYDVWQIGRMYRVAAFAGLGAFLLLTSFLYSRFRGSIESWWRDESASR